MPYAEVHFNSHVFDPTVQYGGTVSRRRLELNDPVYIDRFHVKSVELPLFWINVPKGGLIHLFFDYNTTRNPDQGDRQRFTYTVTFPAGTYSAETFRAKLQELLRAATNPVKVPSPGPDPTTPDLTNIVVQYNASTLKLIVIIPKTDGYGDVETVADGGGFVFKLLTEIVLTIEPPLSKYFSSADALTNEVLSAKPDVADTSAVMTSGVLRLVPNYVYLHSNLMAAAPYLSNTRAKGAFGSRTIVTKIPIHGPEAVFSQSVLVWENPGLSEGMMFHLNGNEFNVLEFWLTDEKDQEIELANTQLSLTLAVFYRDK